jgi:ankyrin repeat protein
MKRYFTILILTSITLCKTHAQDSNELILQNFHSGYNILYIDLESSGERMVSYGSDKELIFYNINKRVIYKRVSITGKREIQKLIINNSNQTVITLQKTSFYPDSSLLVIYSLKNANVQNTISLTQFTDSLNFRKINADFMQLSSDGKNVWLTVNVQDKYYTTIGYKVFSIDLKTSKLAEVSPPLISNSQLNCFQLINSNLWLATTNGLYILSNSKKWELKWASENNNNEYIASFKADNKENIWLLTNNYFYKLNMVFGNIIKKYALNEEDNFKLINHPFAVDVNGNVFYFSTKKIAKNKYISTYPLLMFNNNNKPEEIKTNADVYLPKELLINETKKILLIAKNNEIFFIDYVNKKDIFKLSNSFSSFKNLSFIAPGLAVANTMYDNIPIRIDYTRCTVKKELLEKEILYADQLKILPKSKIKIVKDGCGINFFNTTTSTFLYRIIPYTNTISFEPKNNTVSENCSYTGLNNFFVTADEHYLVIPSYYPKLCRIQIYDILKKELLHEVDLRPSKDDKWQIINHIAVHNKQPIIYVETFNNNMGGLHSYLIDAVTGKILLKKDYSKSFISYDYCGSFTNTSNQLLLPQNILYDLDSKTDLQLNILGEKPVFSNDDKYIFYVNNDYIYRYEIATKIKLSLGYHHNVKKIITDPYSSLLISLGNDKQIKVWSTTDAKQLYTLLANIPKEQQVQPSYIFVQPDGYFTGGGYYNSFIIKNNNGYILPYEEFDKLYNRPDKLIASTGLAKPELVQQLQQVVEKRLGTYTENNTSSFEAKISNTSMLPILSSENTIQIQLEHTGKELINAYQIWVNGTALYATEGKKIEKENNTNIKEQIEITDKLNRIEVCFFDKQKKTSKHDYIVINKEQNEKPALWVITLGIADYKNKDYNLTYAAKDAKDLADVLSKSKSFTKVSALSILNNDVKTTALNKIDFFLKQAKPQDVVLCFFAGHGVLDNKGNFYCSTYDIDLDNPSVNGIDINQLEQTLYNNKARKKILLVDACHSGLIDETSSFTYTRTDTLSSNVKQTGRGVSLKYKKKADTDTELMHSVFLNINRGNGLTIIAAAAGTEYAYEDAKYKNGLFTYSLISALKSGKADLNNDKSITVSELKHYVEQFVVKLSGGKQRPTNRRFNNYSDFEIWNFDDREKGQLYTAASNDDTTTIKKLIDLGYDIDEEEEKSGFTPLHYSARENAVNSINWLLKNGASVNKFTTLGFTPIYLAVVNNNIEATYLLICANSKTDSIYNYSSTDTPKSLMQIANIKNNKHIAYLLKNKIFIQENHNYINKLYDIILTKDENALLLDKTLSNHNPNINFVQPNLGSFRTLIMVATIKGDTNKVKTLLNHGASLKRIEFSNFAPLHLAAFLKNKIMVQFLLNNGADKNELSSQNKRPVDYVKDDNELSAILK